MSSVVMSEPEIQVPMRVFLDTSVLNFILDHGECIFDGINPPDDLPSRAARDIEALRRIFATGGRAFWQLAVSPWTYVEIAGTQDIARRAYVENWFFEVWNEWQFTLANDQTLPALYEAESERIQWLSYGGLDALPDLEDRVLLCDALTYRCDCFCTRDWKTILKHRDSVVATVEIVTPHEWWMKIRPYASLWA